MTGQRPIEVRDQVVARFAGDSGDGIQLIGELFTSVSALAGNDVATLPDYPAEIRAPAGTVDGVSGYQLCFGSSKILTPGDQVDLLIAMNPAALKVNLGRMKEGGLVLVNSDAFEEKSLEKAGYDSNPIEGEQIGGCRLLKIPMTTLTTDSLADSTLSTKQVARCKNFLALGVVHALFDQKKDYTIAWLQKKFAGNEAVMKANLEVFEAGYIIGRDSDALPAKLRLRNFRRAVAPGTYRQVSGNVATAMGLMAAAERAGLRLFLGSYPITPATEIMQELSRYPGICTVFQAEDEIAGIGTAIGASFGGALAATSTSGPGFSLMTEFIGLGVIAELPLIVVNVQRAGPSTGIPTKTEQADLLQAIWGRHGESPLVVVASTSPTDCFDTVIEAARIALKYMTPVIMLSDGYIGHGSEIWRVPELSELPKLETQLSTDPEGFRPYNRDPETLARPWAVPGTPGMEHRLGGLEKQDGTGAVNQSALNHEEMTMIRQKKIDGIGKDIPMPEVFGPDANDLLVIGWGSTFGVIRQAVTKLHDVEARVSTVHLRHLNPLPDGFAALLRNFRKVLVVENNSGQLWYHLRGKFLLDAERLNKVQGQPFKAAEIEGKVRSILKGMNQ